MNNPSTRAKAVTLRTYCRPLKDGRMESWSQVVRRVVEHQQWLWERAAGRKLKAGELDELDELAQLILNRKVFPSGRTLWLGGTDVAQSRESSMFNCAFTKVETVYDIVDVLWLLLQGCGVGFRPSTGTLHGYRRPLESIRSIKSCRTDKGRAENRSSWNAKTQTYTLQVGDSAEAWAKAAGKLVGMDKPARHLVLDFSQIRPEGERLKGYGWISSGDAQIRPTFEKIAKLLSNRAECLLTKIDILDIVNHLGTILSSRRSAEIALMPYGDAEWERFARAKKDWWVHDRPHRQMSNNSLLFYTKPSHDDLIDIFDRMIDAGGSEPGMINAESAKQRAPWFKGCNPCAEILLGNKSFCNLVEVNLCAFKGDGLGLERAITLAARMNYRQTCVDLRDGILQESWHKNNDYLRLCGVGLTGITGRPDLGAYDFRRLRNIAISSAYGMAESLDAPRPKNVTTIKPSGTLSKVAGTDTWGEVPEGAHKPLGRYVFNNVTYSKHDPIVPLLKDAGYEVISKPFEPEAVLVTFPVEYKDVYFEDIEGLQVNRESAILQLERYKMLQLNWCDQNVSVTVSYDPSEKDDIVKWLQDNWEHYVGVSFIFRTDPTKTAKDLGYAYLPQEVVTKETYDTYCEKLSAVDFTKLEFLDVELEDDCEGGACPIR